MVAIPLPFENSVPVVSASFQDDQPQQITSVPVPGFSPDSTVLSTSSEDSSELDYVNMEDFDDGFEDVLDDDEEENTLQEVLKLELPSSSGTSATSTVSAVSNSRSFPCEKCHQRRVPVGLSSCPIVYKDVVVIGNGPSGIALSYFLAGNWPYYNGCGESVNEMLHYRLLAAQQAAVAANNNNNCVSNPGVQPGSRQSIIEQDLRFLAQVS